MTCKGEKKKRLVQVQGCLPKHKKFSENKLKKKCSTDENSWHFVKSNHDLNVSLASPQASAINLLKRKKINEHNC